MDVRQLLLTEPFEALPDLTELLAIRPQLALVFGPEAALRDGTFIAALTQALPGTLLLGCSAAGVITATGVFDGACTLTAIHFESARLRAVTEPLLSMEESFGTGAALARQLQAPDLTGMLVLAQGVHINGTRLLEGLQSVLGVDFPIFGGLAGDDAHFQTTWTLLGDRVSKIQIVALAFYGSAVTLRSASMGGWEPFGPVRKITDSHENILRTLDGEPALEVYRRYLGEWAKELPASALLFPFALYRNDLSDTCIVRTILGIDEASGSLILAGNAPRDGFVRLMHASTNALVEGARAAAEDVGAAEGSSLALLFSCIGRKLVLGGRVDEEVEAVASALGSQATLAGFYSYGEIGPAFDRRDCVLHNQTMTLTLLTEAAPCTSS